MIDLNVQVQIFWRKKEQNHVSFVAKPTTSFGVRFVKDTKKFEPNPV